jgi:hypothetical protein
MRWAFRTYGGSGLVHTGFWWEDLRGRDHLEDLVVDGRIILKWVFKGSVTQDRNRWRALVNAVMKLRVP